MSLLCAGLVLTLAVAPLIHSYHHLLLAPLMFFALLALDQASGAPGRAARRGGRPLDRLFHGHLPPQAGVNGIVSLLFAPLLAASAAVLGRQTAIW